MSNTINTVGISSNALFGNSANNLILLTFLLMQNFYQHSNFSADKVTILFLCKNYVNADAQCADVNIGGRK